MGKIIILDENTANKIAAGEVIERPASVIKELVENSIDAGATKVTIEIKNGGISFIRVVDNGAGISEDDVQMAFERHATSKIRRADDLESILTMGFRGEALASIAAVSAVELSTRSSESLQGVNVKIKGGSILDIKSIGCPVGTTIIVKELFFNTPARYKFLKKDSTEASHVADMLGRIALGHPDISFKLINNGATVLQTPGNGDLKSTIFTIYGAETTKHLIEINYSDDKVKTTGFVGKAEIARSTRRFQSVYINRRFIRSKTITAAIDAAYATFLMKNKYAFAVLNVIINPALVDVNVHPSKMEVKFSCEQDVYRAVYHSVNSALISQSSIMSLPNYDKIKNADYNFYEKKQEAPVFSQLDTEWIQSELEKKSETVDEKPSFDFVVKNHKDSFDNVPQIAPECSEEPPFPSLNKDARLIGQAFSTYLLLERGEELFLIDQHAAHERIRYEELKKAFAKDIPLAQTLLSVIHIELTPGDYQFAMNEAAYFEKLGFTYESFGTNSVILRSAPFNIDGLNIKEIFLEILDFVMNENIEKRSTITDAAIFKIACKSAVKANTNLNEMEIESLLTGLAALDNPYTCPHGRPAILKARKYDLEKLFKRIV